MYSYYLQRLADNNLNNLAASDNKLVSIVNIHSS